MLNATLKKPPASETGASTIEVLVANPSEAEYAALRRMLPSDKWALTRAATVDVVRTLLRSAKDRFSVLVCERELTPGTWRNVMDQLQQIVHPPLLIVSSRFADERLWAEALNLGAYDVLATPFEADEVRRVLGSAWRRWAREHASSPAYQHTKMEALRA